MLPARLRYWLFDRLSVQTMRYVSSVPTREASGLTERVYEMIREDFFKNGSLTGRSAVPELMAAIWTLGREAMLVEDRVDRTTKDAMAAVLSQINDCAYCEDMLISLVHAAGDHDAAGDLFRRSGFSASDDLLRRRLEWLKAVATGGDDVLDTPFTGEQLPEVIGTLMGMTDINRYSHVVMESSPVGTPFGLRAIKAFALRLFGLELNVTRSRALTPGRSLDLLPAAELPPDLAWAAANPRVGAAVARWVAAVEREGERAIPPGVRERVRGVLERWEGEPMPLDARWIDEDVEGLAEGDRAIARLAVVLAKAPYRVTDGMAREVLAGAGDTEGFVRILAWSSYATARRFAALVAGRAVNPAAEEVTAAA
jgi:hypothetical protein